MTMGKNVVIVGVGVTAGKFASDYLLPMLKIENKEGFGLYEIADSLIIAAVTLITLGLFRERVAGK